MSLTLSGTNGVVGAGFTIDPSGINVAVGVVTATSINANASGLTGELPAGIDIPAAQIVGVCTSGLSKTGGFGLYSGYAIIEDQKAHGTNPQTTSANAWNTKELTRIYANPQNIVSSLSSNQFTLVAGTYFIKWHIVLHRVDIVTTRLYDVTNSAVKKVSMFSFSQDNGNYGAAHSEGVCRLTITESTTYRYEYNSTVGNSSGIPSNTNASNDEEEIYATVEIYKEQ